MNFKCYINGRTFENVVIGTPFVDEYNETLDSATIILDQIQQFNFSIGDDVWIFDSTVTLQGKNTQGWYKHYLVSQFSATRMSPTSDFYKYVIELDSETKGLENIALPNKSFTLSKVEGYQKTVWQVLNEIMEYYCPTKFVYRQLGVYDEVKKYTFDPSVQEIFDKVYCPSFQLNNPNLRDVISQLFLVKDCIPVVKDSVIYAYDITKRTGAFDTTKGIVDISYSQSRENYADGLKRTYSNALSEDNTAKRVEYLGFRNSDEVLMTLENMRVETNFPIYKIDKIYMCYYKKLAVFKNEVFNRDIVFLCKQDITPLVKLSQEKQILSQDWIDFNANTPSGINCVNDMAKYKLCTVEYSIGSNTITGWGTKYSYPEGWWTRTNTYLQNIFEIIDKNIPFGIDGYNYVSKNLANDEIIVANYTGFHGLVCPYNDITNQLKSLFFQIEYEAFFNGTVIQSKDTGRDDIIQNDNSSSSLTILEKDGLFQKEKISRIGNPAIVITARYDSLNDLQPLGSYFDDDIIIYHREYQVYGGYVNAIYYGTKDYVLKNYFTSVFAKLRPYNLLSYDESILRSENRNNQLLLSKTNYYTIRTLAFECNMFTRSIFKQLVSFHEQSPQPTDFSDYESAEAINYALITNETSYPTRHYYTTDINTFVSGYSLCFNFAMVDNVGMGNYIKEMSHSFTLLPTGDYTGSVQDFYNMVTNVETGSIDYMNFIALHVDKSSAFEDKVQNLNDFNVNSAYENMNKLPLIPLTKEQVEGSGASNGADRLQFAGNIYKDNKEKIDMTFQFEPICHKDIFISEWFMKLSNLYGKYRKYYQDYSVTSYVTDINGQTIAKLYVGSIYKQDLSNPTNSYRYPLILIEVNNANLNLLGAGANISANFTFSRNDYVGIGGVQEWGCQLLTVNELTNNEIKININNSVKYKNAIDYAYHAYSSILTLNKITSLAQLPLDTTNKTYYCNINENFEPNPRIYVNVPINSFPTEVTGLTISGLASIVSTESNFNKLRELALTTAVEITKAYPRNMYCFMSTEKIKKELVYDRLDFADLPTFLANNPQFDNQHQARFDLVYTDNKNYINGLWSPNYSEAKSIVMYYLDDKGKMNFVFGVNLTTSEIANGNTKVYVSLLKSKDTRVFYDNGLIWGGLINGQ